MATAKKTVKAPAQTMLAQSIEDVTAFIAKIGECDRATAALTLAMDGEIASIKSNYADKINAEKAKIPPLQLAIQSYCEANRNALTKNSSTKTVDFVTGKVLWRYNPDKVRITGEDDVLALIKMSRKKAIKAFLRVKYSIDRDALLKNPAAAKTIDGVMILDGEETFVIEPAQTTDQNTVQSC